MTDAPTPDASDSKLILKLRIAPFTGCIDSFDFREVDAHNASASEQRLIIPIQHKASTY
jgi:hypothetical protein